jgi:ubiquinone/menaquinone biosynthesis C-methylase UbiE
MPTTECCRPVESPHNKGPHRTRSLAVTMVLGGGFSLILYNHGVSWWLAPLAVSGVVLAHMVILGGIVFSARRVTRRRGSPGRATSRQGETEHSHEAEGALLHRPRLFDWLVQVIMLGRERKLREWMLKLIDLESGDVVLDVGCGTGTLLLAAAERVGPSGALHGIEPSTEMAAHARQKAEARGVSLEVVEGSAGSLPYPPASFDAVFCTLVLHHLPTPMRDVAIREMRRVLRPCGRVVIIDWQRPKSLARAITGGLSLASLLHKLRPGASPSDVLDIEPLMIELGLEDITRHAFGSGVLVAVVGRLGSRTRAIHQTESQGITRVRSDA